MVSVILLILFSTLNGFEFDGQTAHGRMGSPKMFQGHFLEFRKILIAQYHIGSVIQSLEFKGIGIAKKVDQHIFFAHPFPEGFQVLWIYSIMLLGCCTSCVYSTVVHFNT